MATIHVFRPVPRSPSPRHPGSAEIIIFPGVRYERWDDDAPTSLAAPKRSKRAKPARSKSIRKRSDAKLKA